MARPKLANCFKFLRRSQIGGISKSAEKLLLEEVRALNAEGGNDIANSVQVLEGYIGVMEQDIAAVRQALKEPVAPVPAKESPQPAKKAAESAKTTPSPTRKQSLQVGTATPNGARATVEWDVVDASELGDSVESEVNENQTRQRKGDRASDEQRLKIASNPDTNLLGDFPTGMNGAPIMDGAKVIAGNGRMGGILLGYGSQDAGIGKKFTAVYKPFVVSEAQRMGLGDKAAGMAQPVLVRRVVSYDAGTKQDFIDQNNPKDGGILRESRTDEGMNDARALGDKLMGDLTFRGNGDLTTDSVVGATAALEKASRAPHRDRAGNPDVRELTRRVQQAYLASMAKRVGRPIEDLVSLLDSDKGRRLMAGVLRAAPELAGFDGDLSLDKALIDTLVSYQRGLKAVESGQMASMAEWAQNRRGELLADGTPESNALLDVFVEADARPAVMRDFFEQYVRAAGEENYRRKEASQSDDMFGEARQPVPVVEVMKKAREAGQALRASPAAPQSARSAVEDGFKAMFPHVKTLKSGAIMAGDTTWPGGEAIKTIPGGKDYTGIAVSFRSDPLGPYVRVEEINVAEDKRGTGQAVKMLEVLKSSGLPVYHSADMSGGFWEHIKKTRPDLFNRADLAGSPAAPVVTKEQDDEYMAAATRGDKAAAQKLVNEAAIRSGQKAEYLPDSLESAFKAYFDAEDDADRWFAENPAPDRGRRTETFGDVMRGDVMNTAQRNAAQSRWTTRDEWEAASKAVQNGVEKARDELVGSMWFRELMGRKSYPSIESAYKRIKRLTHPAIQRRIDIKENGGIVPLSERFPGDSRIISSPAAPFVVTPELDAAYLDAVERGYTDSAQAMVVQVAKARGYVKEGEQFTKKGAPPKSSEAVVRDDSGKVIPLSWRFNPDSADLRYSPAAPERDAEPGEDIDAEEIAALMAELESDMPSVEELEWLTAMAMGEDAGARTVGNPNVAGMGDDPETRQRLDAVRLSYDMNRDKESHEQWATAAKEMLESDPNGVKLQLLEAAAEGRALDSPEMVMASKLLIPELTRQAWLTGDKKLEREAQMLAYAYAKSGTEQARAFSARFDPHKTPGERRKEYLAKLLYTPDPQVRAEIEKAPTPAEKRRRIASLERQIRKAKEEGDRKTAGALDRELRSQKATPDQMEMLETENAKRIQDIERALKREGLSVDDLFEGRATVRLKLGKIVADTLGESDERRTKAIDLLLHGWPDVEIARATGFSRQQVEELSRSLTPQVVEDLLTDLFMRGYTMDDIGVANLASRMAASPAAVQGLAGREGTKMTPEQAREMARKVAKLLVPTSRQRNSRKWKKVTRKDAPTQEGKPTVVTRTSTVTDGPIQPEVVRRKQDVMIYGGEALSPEEQKNINRPRQPGTEPVTPDPGLQGKLDIPRTGPVPSDTPVSAESGVQGKLAIPRTGPTPTDRPVSADAGRQSKLDIKTGPDAPDAPLPSKKEMREGQGKQQKLDLDPETDEFVPFDPEDPVQAYRIERVIDVSGATWLDKAQEYWINGILSGLGTHLVNIYGNTASAAWDMTAQRGMELIANSMVRDPNSAQWGEMKHLIRGLAPGLVKGFKMAMKAFDAEADVTSDEFLDQQAVFGEGGFDKGQRIKAAIGGKPGRVIRLPGRMLMAMDAFFKTTIGMMEVGAQAYRIGKAMGYEGAELENFIAKETATPGSASWVRAMEKAKELAFQKDIKTTEQGGHAIDNAAAGISRFVSSSKLLRFIFPFIKTPYNIFKTGLRKTPGGSIPMLFHAARGVFGRKPGESFRQAYERGNPGVMVKELAEQTLAYMLLATLWQLAEGGEDEDEGITITGGRPGGRETSGERDLQSRLQGGSYQVMYNGKPVFSYGRIEPAATVIGSMVDAIRMIKSSRTPASKVGALLGSVASQVQQKTFTQGFAGMADTTAALMSLGKDAAAETFMNNARDWLIEGMVPNIVRQTARNIDDTVRNRKASSPANAALPSGMFAEPLIDPYGREMKKDGSAGTRLVFPQPLKTDPHPGDVMLDRYAKKNPDESYHPLRSTMANYRYEVDKERKEFSDPEKTAYDKIRGMGFDSLLRDYFRQVRDNPRAPRDPVTNPTEEDIEEYKTLRSKAGREAKVIVRDGGWKERIAELEAAQKLKK
jgi:hypothetical protein